MKIKMFFMWAMLLLASTAMAQSVPEYDLTGAGSGNEGMALVKVFVYGKKVSDADLKRCAVHGVVFRGYNGNNSGANQPAMAPAEKENEKKQFCKEFFDEDGQCQNYASVMASSYERVKTKKGYKCGAIVEVNKAALRQFLEKAGLVRSLSSGF